MFKHLNDHLRPSGAPQNWGIYSLSSTEHHAPAGYIRWKGRHFGRRYTRGKRAGRENWKAPRDIQWDRVGFIDEVTYRRLVAEWKKDRDDAAHQAGKA